MTTPDPEATVRQESGDVPLRPRSRGVEVQFAPGTIIAGRYRIASILGSGGMGEVYRADDVKLDQPVALKFLPARLARDPMLLGRLHDEVRLGRQIAHPNVCRIYDIVDSDGAHFVSMEFVDGEDLSRLLHRIGRLAHDKAVDMTRGIAAGLMAAHAKGILHRDLKPANVMIDSHGDAKIMDFGLALSAGEDDGTISGTPAYMAPEQLAGTPATIQSDLYALGLVMYELFTGKRAHNARTMPERLREISSEITTPSSVIRDIDPLVERVILRCLSNDPAQRPRSAREVIDSLPGGDPLAAALAAGETPSPRVVAAAGAEGSYKPWQAWTMLATIAVLTTLLLVMYLKLSVTTFTRVDLSPEVLRQRTTEVLRTLGVAAKGEPVEQIISNDALTAWLSERKDPQRWAALKNGPGLFRYRLEFGPSAELSRYMPMIANAAGWTTVEVDPHGRLLNLLTMPDAAATAKRLDWRPLLVAAGFNPDSLRAVPPKDTPVSPFDARAAWTGSYPGDRTPIRIEAAAWRGTPVYLRVGGPWEEDTGALERARFGSSSLDRFAQIVIYVLVAAAIVLAWRNLRTRRGDRAGALRLAAVVFVLQATAGILADVSKAGVGGIWIVERLGKASFDALSLFFLYIALEPYARRRWPEQLIAWARLIAGRPRDPLVGRHVLIGIAAGVAHALLGVGGPFVLRGFSRDAVGPLTFAMRPLDIPGAVSDVAAIAMEGIFIGCATMTILVLFTILLRRRALAAAGLFAFTMTFYYLARGHTPGVLPAYVLIAALETFITVRYGLLAAAVFQTTFFLVFMPPFAPGTAWVTPLTLIPFVVLIAASVWAFLTSLGGQSPFNATLLDE